MWLENQKIWKFENPEDLAKALDNKNQNLADRIREISKTAIEKDSRDLRKVLQEELTPEEQSEIREALPESWVEKILDKKTSSDIGKEAVWDIIWEENADKIDTLTKKSEKLSKNFDKIWEIFKSKWIMAWLWAILLMFKWLFTWDFSWLDKILNPKKEWEKSWKKEAIIDSAKKAEYNLWLRALYLISGKELTQESNNTLLSPQLQKSTFSKLEKEYKNKNWIASRLWFEENQSDDEKVYSTITLLLKSEKWLNNIFWKENTDWKDLELIDLISILNQKWGWVLSNMKEKVEKIEFNWLDPIWNMTHALWSLKNMLEVNVSGDKIDFWWLSERKHLLDQVSKETQIKIFMSWNNSWIKKSSQSAEVENNLVWEWSKDDKDFIKKVFDYKNKIIQPIVNLFPKDEQNNANQFFTEKGVTFKELTELYLITWWNPDINNLDWMWKSILFIKIFWILSRDNDKWLSWVFAKELYEQIMDDKSLVLPEETRNILNNIFHKAIEKTIEWTKWLLIDAYKASDTSTKIVVWSIIAGYISWMLFGWKFRFVTQWIWIASTAFAVWYVYNKFMEDPKASKFLKERWIDSQEKFTKEIEKTTKV